MPTSIQKPHWSTLFLLVGILAVLGHQSLANRAAPTTPAPATAVAAFDLEKTFNALEAKKAADASLQKIADEMKVNSDQQSNSIKQMNSDLEDHQPGSAKYRELLERLTLASHEHRAYIEFCKAKIDIQRARTLKRIYLDIRKAVEELAAENGYSVVFVDDSIAEIPPGNEEETNRQISARRIVYTSPEVDVTDELISRMNRAWAAAQAKQ